jgi:drug/metabolite transporter (DMT)-like permease
MNSWVVYALLAMFITGFEVINLKYIELISSDIVAVLALCFVFTGLISLAYLLFNKVNVSLTMLEDYRIILSGLAFAGLLISSRYYYLKSVETAPNIGYTHMIINLNVIITLVLAYLFFSQTINLMGFCGITICLLGLFIIIKYGKVNT